MPSPTADGFDPQARFIARDGIAYKDFAAYLVGRPDAEDLGNGSIARYRKEGRSEAFCRVFRKGYDDWYPKAFVTCHEFGDEAYWAHQESQTRGFAEATRLEGYYHEA